MRWHIRLNAFVTVTHIGWHDDVALASLAHAEDARIEARNTIADAEAEFEAVLR